MAGRRWNPPEDATRMGEAWSRSITSGQPYDIEHRISLPEGEHRWMRSRAVARRDSMGKIVRSCQFSYIVRMSVFATPAFHGSYQIRAKRS
jgi:hypothetical protein